LSENPASGSEVKIIYTLQNASASQVMLMDELGRERSDAPEWTHFGRRECDCARSAITRAGNVLRARYHSHRMSAMQKLVIAH
ncbi:MAG: hypothetical protein ACHQNE_05095, partial [Candidatus Kapaibacterium sp.]